MATLPVSNYPSNPSRLRATNADDEIEGGDGAPNAYRYWSKIVEEYSKKNLTKESDRLIALYGIAQSIKQQYTHDEYVAGMWKKHLLNQLLWMTYTKLKKDRPKYRAPSWSWASVIGKLMFRDILEAEELGVLGAEVTEVSVDTTKGKEGEVTGGYLKIRGKIFTGTWKFAGLTKEVSNSEKNEKVPLWSEEFADNPTNTYSMRMGDSGSLNSLMGYPDVEENGFQSGETICLAIQKREKPAKSKLDKAWSVVIDGLVLMRDESDKLRRIGISMLLGMVPDLSWIEQRRRRCKFFEVVMRVSARDVPWRNHLSVNLSEIQVRMLSGEPSSLMINYVCLETFFGEKFEKINAINVA
jgi:hypothetical protein